MNTVGLYLFISLLETGLHISKYMPLAHSKHRLTVRGKQPGVVSEASNTFLKQNNGHTNGRQTHSWFGQVMTDTFALLPQNIRHETS